MAAACWLEFMAGVAFDFIFVSAFHFSLVNQVQERERCAGMDGKGARTASRHGCTHSQVQVPWNRLELGFSRQSHRVAEHFRRKDVDMRIASSQLRFCREGEAALEMKLQPANTGFIGTMQRLSVPMRATLSPTAHLPNK